jgi:hypothetical protein
MQFKITLNKTAFDYYFKGQEYGGIKVEIHGKRVRFKPVFQSSGPGIIAITERARGGIETRLIEGSESDNLFKALTNPLPYPFFMLERVADGWIEATPWDGPKKIPEGEAAKDFKAEPDRFTPHLRVWPKANAKAPVGQPLYDSFPEIDPNTNTVNMVRENLQRLREAITDIATLPLGKALTQVEAIQDLIRETKPHLLVAARAEAQAVLGKAEPKTEAPKTEAPKVKAKVAPKAEAPKAEAPKVKAKVAPEAAPAPAPAARTTRVPPRILERIGAGGGHRPLRGQKIGVRA